MQGNGWARLLERTRHTISAWLRAVAELPLRWSVNSRVRLWREIWQGLMHTSQPEQVQEPSQSYDRDRMAATDKPQESSEQECRGTIDAG